MSIQLPAFVADYFLATNKHDIDAMLVPFTADAVVQDEGEEHVGQIAIRAWMVETTLKYRVTIEPQVSEQSSDRTAVFCLVSGSFPGIPTKLSYTFSQSSAGICHLEIQ